MLGEWKNLVNVPFVADIRRIIRWGGTIYVSHFSNALWNSQFKVTIHDIKYDIRTESTTHIRDHRNLKFVISSMANCLFYILVLFVSKETALSFPVDCFKTLIIHILSKIIL